MSDSISITPKRFLERFTMPEVVGIMTSTIPEVVYFRTLFVVSERIVSTDPQLAPGMVMLVSHGLLTQQRHDEIMAWTQV
jgi:hypothetical protein